MSNEKKTEDKPDKLKERILEESSVSTQHSVSIGGKTIDYTATAGTVNLTDEFGNPTASVFCTAYIKEGEDPANRPISFCFNGGPGSSSVWVHMGLLGPKRVLLDDEGNAPPPPYQLVENEYSLLDESDLVFIDPVSTGYCRATTDKAAKKFHTYTCLLYTSPSPRDLSTSRMPSSA